ncbi:MAG: hypothetical protein IJF17_00910 [Thermoguttaceae bacterium]|nr:hypothetical protein [Thermoguttaceae bacterium]
MRELLFSLLKTRLMAMAVEVFTVENVQSVFTRLLAALKAAAAKSQTPVDDWILEMLEKFASETSAAEKFSEMVLTLLDKTNGNVICGSADEKTRLESDIALEFAAHWASNAPTF